MEISEQNKKLYNKVNIIGIYQIIGGIMGLLLVAYTLFISESDAFWTLGLWPVFPVMLFVASVYAGIMLLKHQLHSVWISRIVQLLQLPVISTSAFVYEYIAGALIGGGIHFGVEQQLIFNVSLPDFYLSFNNDIEGTQIFLNVLPLFILYQLRKTGKQLNENKKRIKEQEQG